MAGYTNWDRQYRLSFGQGGSTGALIGEGSQFPLRINFNFDKTDLEADNTGKVSVWNLNDEHLSTLEEDNCIVALRAGYGSTMPLIFSGVATSVTTSLDGADVCTEIELVDNCVEIRNTYCAVSYAGTVSTKTLIEDAAGQMGVAVSFSYNASFTDLPNGFSYVGLAKDILNKACDSSGLTWSIQNGVLQVKKPGDVMSNEVYVLSADTGLIGIPKRVDITDSEDSSKSQKGWEVEYLMNAAIEIDDYVKLESKAVTGYFRVYALSISGDTQEGDWSCTAKLLEVNG